MPFMRHAAGRITVNGIDYIELECGHRVLAPKSTTSKVRPTRRFRCPQCAAAGVDDQGIRAKPRFCRVCGAKLCSYNKGSMCYSHFEQESRGPMLRYLP